MTWAGIEVLAQAFDTNVGYATLLGACAVQSLEPRPVVVLADDEVLVRDLLEDALDEAGFATVVAESGADAIRELEQPGRAVNGLVTDINFGRPPTGWEVAVRARELNPSIAVVYMTGDSGHEWSSRGVPNSAITTKPFAPSQVVVALSSLINKSDAV